MDDQRVPKLVAHNEEEIVSHVEALLKMQESMESGDQLLTENNNYGSSRSNNNSDSSGGSSSGNNTSAIAFNSCGTFYALFLLKLF